MRNENQGISETEQVHLNIAQRLGALIGVTATILGGAAGALTGKLSGKFTPQQGFSVGAAIAGLWTIGAQLVSYKRISNLNPAAASFSNVANGQAADVDQIPVDDLAYSTDHAQSVQDARSSNSRHR